MKRITKSKMIIFAIGQLGWSILAGIISNLLVNFYQPEAGTILSEHPFIYQGSVFLGLTIIGMITAIGRLFDAVTDPLIANKSDNCKSKLGRRIPFMRFSAIPFALITVLVFCAPVNQPSAFNVVWLFVTLMIFYVCMTAYCTPYNALIPVLGREQKDRIDISTYISITYILGTGIAFSAKMIWEMLSEASGMDYIVAARVVLAILAFLALVCMLLPAFLINENDYVNQDEIKSEENTFKSLEKTFKNKEFRIFVLSDILYWIGITIFNTGFLYYVDNLLKTDNYFILFVVMTLTSFLLYIPVNLVCKKVGKKKLVVAGFIMFAFAFFVTLFAGKTAIPNVIYGFIIAVLVGIPLAILGVVPQAIVADIAECDSIESKENHDGMFFAARTFAFKIGQSIAMLIFTSLAVIGNYDAYEGKVEKYELNGDNEYIVLLENVKFTDDKKEINLTINDLADETLSFVLDKDMKYTSTDYNVVCKVKSDNKEDNEFKVNKRIDLELIITFANKEINSNEKNITLNKCSLAHATLNNGTGYRISLGVALIFSLGGALALVFYNEKKVIITITKKDDSNAE